MKKSVIIISLFLLGTAFSAKAQEMTQKEKTNYAIGVLLGKKIQEEITKSGIDIRIIESVQEKLKDKIDFHSIQAGIDDILKGECKLTQEEIMAILAELEKEKDKIDELINAKKSQENKSEGSSCNQYNAACAKALAGEIDAAFEQLFLIANNGSYTNLEHILADADLNSLHKDKRWNEVIEIIRAKIYLPRLANSYGSLSWNYLLMKDYAQSEQSARQALKLDNTQTWVKTNLAHALLFQNRFSEAEKIYKELSKTPRDNEPYTQVLLEDLDKLEKAGVIPEKQKSNVEKIRKMLRE